MQKQTRKRTTKEQKLKIIELWTTGAGKVDEIARTMNMPTSTVYGVLYRSGLWPGYDNYAHGVARMLERREKEKQAKQKEDEAVQEHVITLISAPKRTLMQRIREFFQ